MKKLVLLAITTVLLTLIVSTVLPLVSTVAAQQAENKVGAQFSTSWICDSPDDAFTNSEVTGRNEWHVNIRGEVPSSTLTLDSTLNFDHIMKENLTTTGPPTYVWSFVDIPLGTSRQAYAGFSSLHSTDIVPVTFTPGFDASRHADKTEFSAQGTQTLTIAVTPREAIEQFNIIIFADESELVNPVITSPTNGDGIELRQKGHQLHINSEALELNTTWTITVNIQVTPKVPEVEYIPYVGIGWREPLASGTASGNSLSLPVADMGTWTWSTEGSYEWDWTNELIRHVCWQPRHREIGEASTPAPPLKGNRIDVGFMDELDYEVSGNTFNNTEVTGKRRWRTNFANWPDETGAPAIGVKVMLESELVFDGIEKDNLTRMEPPTYEWYLGDVVEEPERQGWAWDAFVDLFRYPIQFSPGIDVSRSFDKKVFTTTGTQTMTVTLTPREKWVETLTIFVHTDECDIVNPVIISISHTGGGEIKIMEDGHRSGIERIPVELNTPLIIIYTMQVTPKVPEVKYMPHTAILLYRSGLLANNIISGNSFSYTNEAGTWTWSAEGDYIWHWGAPTPDYSVTFIQRAEPATIPDSIPETRQVISWQFVISIVAGAVVVGVVTYLVIRNRRRV